MAMVERGTARLRRGTVASKRKRLVKRSKVFVSTERESEVGRGLDGGKKQERSHNVKRTFPRLNIQGVVLAGS